MRCLLVAAIVAFSSPAWAQFFDTLPGSEAPPAAVEVQLAVDLPAPLAETKVIITPVPMPTSVIEILKPAGRSPKLRMARKVAPAKKKPFPNILLTRTERHQLALLAAKSTPGNLLLGHLFNDENGESAYDVLSLHCFYSRPRLAGEGEHETGKPEADDLSDTIKLRLLLARLKAVEAHALAQVTDPGDDLSLAIRERLAQARHLAVEAHRNKFS